MCKNEPATVSERAFADRMPKACETSIKNKKRSEAVGFTP